MRFFAILSVLLLVGCAAEAWTHGGGGTVACPYTGTASVDGCSGAATAGLAGASLQDATLFSGLTGQIYSSRPAQNVAGVEYPVGVTAGTVLKDLTVDTLPTGCAYNSSASPPQVQCDGTHDFVFDGWTSPTGTCVMLNFRGTAAGTLIVRNSKWISAAGCEGSPGAFIQAYQSAFTSMLIEKNYFDGNAASTSFTHLSQWLVSGSSTGTFTAQYNAIKDITGRAFQTSTSGNVTFQYNYAKGFWGSVAHGELAIVDPGSTTAMTLHSVTYNTLYQPPTILNSNVTALHQTTVAGNLYPVAFTTFTTDSNTMIVRPATQSTFLKIPSNDANPNAPTGTVQSPVAGTTITFTPKPSGTATVVTFVAGTPSGNQIQIGANVTATAANALAFLQGSSDLNISHFTYSLSGDSNVYNQVLLLQGDMSTMTVTPTNTISSDQSNASQVMELSGDLTYGATFGTVNWTNNWIDPQGSYNCLAKIGSYTIGTENYSGNKNLYDGSTISDATSANCHGHM